MPALLPIAAALLLELAPAAPRASVPILPSPGASITIGIGTEGEMSQALKIVLLLTLLAFAPALLVSVTSFTRIVIVLAFARQALGTGQTPPNQVIVGLALFLTLFSMAPTAGQIQREAVQPYVDKQIGELDAFERGIIVLKGFMLRQTREADLGLFYEIAAEELPRTALDVPMRIAVPAFMLSELKTAFQMGFTIFIPFLLIDLIVSSILMAMGMMMLPPVLIAMPFKILLFVLADGWNLLLGSIARSFATG